MKKLLILVGSGVTAALVLELVLAVFFPQATLRRIEAASPAMYGPSETMPYELISDSTVHLKRAEFETTIHVNSHGHRGPEFDWEKGDQHRVLVVGDSFTFGYGVEDDETYSARLQERLAAKHPERAIEVINAGFAACYYPDTYYLYLREKGLSLDPDLVVLGFFVGNDVDHERVTENVWVEVDDDRLPVRIQSQDIRFQNGHRVSPVVPRRYRYPVLRNSHLTQALAAFVLKNPVGDPLTYFNHWMYRDEYLERTTERVEMVQRLFLAISDLTREAGVPLLVVLIPTREQLHPEEYPFADYPYMENADMEKPQRIFREFFEESGIAYVDVLPAMREATREQGLYFPMDRHWNRVGHDVASRAIVEALPGIE